MKRLAILLLATWPLAAETKPAFKLAVVPKAEVKSDIEIPFQITVKDAKGMPVDGAQVEVVATMVEMDHGEFKYQAKAAKHGVYEFSPKFMMGGSWNLAVKVQKGANSANLNQKVEVKD